MDMLQYKIARVLLEEFAEALIEWAGHNSQDPNVQAYLEGLFDLEGEKNNSARIRLSDKYYGMTLLTCTDGVFDINEGVKLICLSVQISSKQGGNYCCNLGITDSLHYVTFKGSDTKYEDWKVAIAAMAKSLKDHFVNDLGWIADPESDGGYSTFRHYLLKV